MENRFKAAMAKHTDVELIKIVTVERDGYQPMALEAAEEEIRRRGIDISTFEELKAALVEKREAEQQQERNNIDASVRVVHWVVDSLAYHFLFFGLMLAAGTFILPQDDDDLFMAWVYGSYAVAFFGYYVLMEHFFQKTLGKFITKTKVVAQNGERADVGTILLRTVCRLIPFDNITFLVQKEGIHDSLSKTKLVRDKR